MKIKEGFVLKEIAGSNIVVPIGENTVNFNGIMTLNDSGAFIWNLLQSETTKEALLKAFLKEYNIDEVTAKQDIDAFILKITEADLIE